MAGKKLIKRGVYDKIDKYRAHLIEGAELTAAEAEMLSRYRKASSLMCNGDSRMHTVAILQEEYGISEPQAYFILRDSIKLYGDANELDKQGMRYIMYENFMRAAKLAENLEDIQSMNRSLENACKLYDLFNFETLILDPSMFKKPAVLIFTDDPEVLREQQTEDVDFDLIADE